MGGFQLGLKILKDVAIVDQLFHNCHFIHAKCKYMWKRNNQKVILCKREMKKLDKIIQRQCAN